MKTLLCSLVRRVPYVKFEILKTKKDTFFAAVVVVIVLHLHTHTHRHSTGNKVWAVRLPVTSDQVFTHVGMEGRAVCIPGPSPLQVSCQSQHVTAHRGCLHHR